jgi:hypothetical protein
MGFLPIEQKAAQPSSFFDLFAPIGRTIGNLHRRARYDEIQGKGYEKNVLVRATRRAAGCLFTRSSC